MYNFFNGSISCPIVKMKCLYISFMLFAYYCMTWGQNFTFPTEEPTQVTDDNSTIITERISEPNRQKPDCPENMIAYEQKEGAKDTTWVCDCGPRLLYFLLNDSCYEPYRQGPCPPKQYIILPEGEIVARCVENPCLKDGIVPYNGTCESLKTTGGPCVGGILGVNEVTFQLECIDLVPEMIIVVRPREICPLGSRISTEGVCKKVKH